MYFLQLHSELFGWVSFGLIFFCIICGVITSEPNDEPPIDDPVNEPHPLLPVLFSVLVVFLLVISIAFGLTWLDASDNYNTLVSSHPANVLKVVNLSVNGASITYIDQDNPLKNYNYTGPIKVDASLKQSTADLEVHKNIFGDQETIITHLVVPKDDVL